MIMRIPALHMLVRKAEWEESKHPRADNGQFGSGSGGSKKPSKTRRKMERREEAASQARVGGAIQSLLSGGSALDKIGWLNTSQKEPEKPAAKPKEEAAPAKEPSILDTINQRNEQAASMRGKVPSMEHPSQRRAREGGPEGGHSPRVLTQAERDYRDNQRQTEDARRRAGVPIPGDQLATLEIPGNPKQQEKPKAEEKPKPPTSKPVLTRGEAERFISGSKYRADVYHVTSERNAQNIKNMGFKSASGQSLGASWGNGTYLALDDEATNYYHRLTPNSEKLTLKVNVKNPITFDASNISDIEGGAKAIAEQIGRSDEYDRIRSELDIKNKKIEHEATVKFGRLPRVGQKLPGESDDAFNTRFEDTRQKRIAFMREKGAHEFPHSDALTLVAQAAGYDSIIIRDKEFRPSIGGNQMVVFNPENVKVVEEMQDPEPETWYSSDKYQRAADTLLSNLTSGKINVSDADKIHAEKTKAFTELARNKTRSESENLKMQKISNELGAMQYALNRFKQGKPDVRRRRF